MTPEHHPRYAHVRHSPRRAQRLQVLICLAAVMLAVPALIARAPAEAQDSKTPTRSAAPAPATTSKDASTTTSSSSTTVTVAPTTASPTTAAPSTTAWTAPSTTAAPTTAAPTTASPTTAAPATTAAPRATAPPAPTRSESGIASYYDDPNNGCAHKTLPFGTVVHITASNGKTATCVVDDRGPFGPGRILDLDTAIFAQLAPLSSGLVHVTATW